MKEYKFKWDEESSDTFTISVGDNVIVISSDVNDGVFRANIVKIYFRNAFFHLCVVQSGIKGEVPIATKSRFKTSSITEIVDYMKENPLDEIIALQNLGKCELIWE